MKRRSFRNHKIFHFVFAILLLAYILVGFRIYPDYGVPVDEYSQIDLGRVNYERIAKGSREIQTHYDRYYGPAFEVPLYLLSGIVQKQFGVDQMSARHLGVFLFYSFSLIVLYRLLSTANGHPLYGILGVVLLVVSPRFFAESFYNTKDVAFMSVTILVLYAVSKLGTPTWRSLLFLAAMTGFAVAIRAQGLLLFVVNILVLSGDAKTPVPRRLMYVIYYAALTFLITFGLFPVFWNDTWRNIIGFWQASANPIGVPTRFLGTSYISPDIPWSYHFVWVGVTSLVSVLVVSLLGICWFVVQYAKRWKRQHKTDRLYPVMLLLMVGTFLTSVLFHPRSYDGWRHVYYIYPSMIGYAVYAVRHLMDMKSESWRRAGIVVLSVFLIDGISATRFILNNHPNQYVYFNVFSGGYPNAKANFDFDYWGISQKQILEYLMRMPTTDSLRVYVDYIQPSPYTERVFIPSLRDKGMITVDAAQDAQLYIAINRDFRVSPPPGFAKVFAAQVEGVDLSAVYAASGFRL